MTAPRFDRDFWEQLWSKTLRDSADKVARRPPNAHLMAEAADLPPGRAVDVGCGHGADALWLAMRGWHVTAVDFSPAALRQGRSMAEAAGAEIAARIAWIESDIATWTVQPGRYDLVSCLYVHVAGSVEDMVRRLARALLRAGRCSWWDTVRSTPAPEPPRPPRPRRKCQSRPQSPRSTPRAGSWSSPKSVRAPLPAPASMP